MAKDALGHGSDKRNTTPVNRQTTGMHQTGVLKIQKFAPNKDPGVLRAPWQTVKAVPNATVAETVADDMRTDARRRELTRVNSGGRLEADSKSRVAGLGTVKVGVLPKQKRFR
jgi:hypothetical protein